MGKRCLHCGDPMPCYKPACQKPTTGATGNGRPVLFDLKQQLTQIILNYRGPLPGVMPRDAVQAASWWIDLQKPEGKTERAYRVDSAWLWKYAERLIDNLKWFLTLDNAFHQAIVAAKQDGFHWNGEKEIGLFMDNYNEMMEFREDPEKYKKTARNRARQIIRATAMKQQKTTEGRNGSPQAAVG